MADTNNKTDNNNDVNNITIEEERNKVINSLVPQCRTIGKNFFNCVETRLMNLSSDTNKSYKDLENELSSTVVPECMSKFNLEDCLAKNDSNL